MSTANQLEATQAALVTTRARILVQLAYATQFNRKEVAQQLRCVLILLDANLGPCGPTRKVILTRSSKVYRGLRKMERANAKARANRIADRCAIA